MDCLCGLAGIILGWRVMADIDDWTALYIFVVGAALVEEGLMCD